MKSNILTLYFIFIFYSNTFTSLISVTTLNTFTQSNEHSMQLPNPQAVNYILNYKCFTIKISIILKKNNKTNVILTELSKNRTLSLREKEY